MKKNFRLIISLLVLTLVVFIAYNISQLENEISEKQYDNLVNDLSRVTNNFGIWINNKKDMLDTSKDVLNNFHYDDINKWKTGNPYLNINNDNPDVSQVYIGLSDGGFVTGGQWIPPDDYDPRTRTWYQEAVAADGTIVSKVYFDRETGEQLVTISSPLYMDNTFVGVISADVFLNNIHEYLKTQMSADNVYTYLLDNEGVIILHTSRENLIGQNLYSDIRIEALIDYFEEVKNSASTIRMEYIYNEQNIRGIMNKVEGGDWYLSVALEYEDRLFGSVSLNRGNLMVNVFGLLIMLILISMIFRMKTELESVNKHLINENEKDFLTSIYNRKYLNLYLDRLWFANNEKNEVSILMMDIDYFKAYNDTYGHIKGDEVLISVAECITETVRKGDVLARYGGEEFLLVMDDVSGDVATKVGTDIKDAIYELNIEHEASSFKRITISIGIVTVTPNSEISVRDAIDQADNALYEAKEKGRNSVVVY